MQPCSPQHALTDNALPWPQQWMAWLVELCLAGWDAYTAPAHHKQHVSATSRVYNLFWCFLSVVCLDPHPQASCPTGGCCTRCPVHCPGAPMVPRPTLRCVTPFPWKAPTISERGGQQAVVWGWGGAFVPPAAWVTSLSSRCPMLRSGLTLYCQAVSALMYVRSKWRISTHCPTACPTTHKP